MKTQSYRRWLLGVAWRMSRKGEWREVRAALAEIVSPGRSSRQAAKLLKSKRS